VSVIVVAVIAHTNGLPGISAPHVRPGGLDVPASVSIDVVVEITSESGNATGHAETFSAMYETDTQAGTAAIASVLTASSVSASTIAASSVAEGSQNPAMHVKSPGHASCELHAVWL
jgi:hypothetical protein